MIRRCGKCQVEVRHEVTTNGVQITLDADTHPDGEFVLELPEDSPAVARWIPAWPPTLREDAHRTQGLYRYHPDACSPPVVPEIEGAA